MDVGNTEKRCWEEESVNVGNREKEPLNVRNREKSCWVKEPVNAGNREKRCCRRNQRMWGIGRKVVRRRNQ